MISQPNKKGETTEMNDLKTAFLVQVEEIESELIKIRQYLHKHPELSYQEYETANYIEKQLTTMGISNKRISKTGVIALIEGEKESTSKEKITIGIRADTDALPIHEQTGLPFSSVNQGVMHACGHDGHTAILLGAAQLLQQNKNEIAGNILCVFQHAEEEGGGAKELIDLGIIETYNVSAFMALHLWPHLPLGTIGIRYGSMTAACDDFDIKIVGKSGHSARPNEGIDAISIAIKIINSIQQMKLSMISPLDASVIHFGQINGGSGRNVIADQVTIKGTVRSLTPKVREKLAQEINRLAQSTGEMFGAQVSVNYEYGPAPVTNDDLVTQVVAKSSQSLWGTEKLTEIKDPSLGADDFGEFAQKVPSTYFRLGIRDHKHHYDLHHPKFSFDEKALSIGAATFAYSAINTISEMEEKKC